MKSRFLLAAMLVATLPPAALTAQRSEVPAAAPQNATAQEPARERQPDPVPSANVRIELAITDTVAGAPPTRKTVSMVVADGRPGRIRAQGAVVQADPTQPQLSVDATPNLSDGSIRLQISIEYLPPVQSAEARRFSRVSEFATVLLQSGKPMVITESSDPSADRKVTVEVTATILK